MLRAIRYCVVVLSVALSATGCATTAPPSFSKPGFFTELRDGRLWVFREGSKELEDFRKNGAPAHQVSRVGGGPNGMTIKSSDGAVIDEYLAAK